MIISKQNLLPVALTKPDKNIPVLDCLRIENDGSSIGGNGKSFIVVSPVPENLKVKVGKIYGNEKSESVTVTSETVKEVLKNIPSDSKYGGLLEHTEVISKEGNAVDFVLYDGARKRNISGKVNPALYPPYRKLFQRALDNKKSIQLVVNSKRFLPLIETLIKCSNDSGDFSPMYIEFTEENDIVIRMINPKTEQRCIGIMWSNKGPEAKWLEESTFEKGLKNGNNDVKGNSMVHNSVNGNGSGRNMDNNRNLSNNKTVPSGLEVHKERKVSKGAKRTGNRRLAHIIDEMCPDCNKFHLATDGRFKWCSCMVGCNYFTDGNKEL